jgi:hypothetical protein
MKASLRFSPKEIKLLDPRTSSRLSRRMSVCLDFPRALALAAALAGICQAAAPPEEPDPFEGMEEQSLLLAKIGETTSLNLLSIKGFTCREKISLVTMDKKQVPEPPRLLEHRYQVLVEKSKKNPLQPRLVEKRLPLQGTGGPAEPIKLDFPSFEEVFTGYLLAVFTFENRLANDYRLLPSEKWDGRECTVLAFESAPELTSVRIPLFDKWVSLRQQGKIWVDVSSFRILHLTAQQKKLPGGWKRYQYEVDIRSLPALGPKIFLPVAIRLEVEWNKRIYKVEQVYCGFEPAP